MYNQTTSFVDITIGSAESRDASINAISNARTYKRARLKLPKEICIT